MNLENLPTDELIQPEFSIGETHYTVIKFGSLEGWRVFEHIRLAVGTSDLDIDGNLDNKAILGWIKAILALDLSFVDGLRVTLFKNISFRNTSAASPQPLSGAEDMAIAEPLHIYEIMFRSLAVNFTPSFIDILSRLGGESLVKLKQN